MAGVSCLRASRRAHGSGRSALDHQATRSIKQSGSNSKASTDPRASVWAAAARHNDDKMRPRALGLMCLGWGRSGGRENHRHGCGHNKSIEASPVLPPPPPPPSTRQAGHWPSIVWCAHDRLRSIGKRKKTHNPMPNVPSKVPMGPARFVFMKVKRKNTPRSSDRSIVLFIHTPRARRFRTTNEGVVKRSFELT